MSQFPGRLCIMFGQGDEPSHVFDLALTRHDTQNVEQALRGVGSMIIPGEILGVVANAIRYVSELHWNTPLQAPGKEPPKALMDPPKVQPTTATPAEVQAAGLMAPAGRKFALGAIDPNVKSVQPTNELSGDLRDSIMRRVRDKLEGVDLTDANLDAITAALMSQDPALNVPAWKEGIAQIVDEVRLESMPPGSAENPLPPEALMGASVDESADEGDTSSDQVSAEEGESAEAQDAGGGEGRRRKSKRSKKAKAKAGAGEQV